MNKFSFLLVFLLFFSCRKNEETTTSEEVKGILLHAPDGQPLAGQTIILKLMRQKIVKSSEPEFPNGKPVIETSSYQVITDASGNFLFRLKVFPDSWYGLELPVGNYALLNSTSAVNIPIMNDMRFYRDNLRLMYDTLLADRTGFLRFHLKHSGGFENESLYINSPYHRSTIRPDKFSNGYDQYNWLFFGNTDLVKTDTLPAETVPTVSVEWLHRLTDTIQYKKELVTVQPGTITDYFINY
jgi:hypothetical protein